MLKLARNGLAMLAAAAMVVATTPGLAFAIDANALPQGGSVVAGSASMDYRHNSLTVNQQSQRAVIDWNSFNIGTNATTEFKQPSSGALAVNRVVGGSADPTQILGTLKSNGQVMVLDPNGILFGSNARIDVGGLLASTGGINVNQVMSGARMIDITNITGGSIVNNGTITARDGGLVALVAPRVANNGVITARMGRVELAAGSAVTVDLYGDKLMELAVNGPLANALVENAGTIAADGGRVALTAKAAQGVVNNVINTTGIIRADSVGTENGRIVLKGNTAGTVRISGQVSAAGKEGNETGGRVDVVANHISVEGASIDVSGRRGGGEAYIGGGVYGSMDGVTAPSAVTEISADSVVYADALKSGNGGTIVFWGSERSAFYGTATARGGSSGGDGGFVEVSTGKGVVFDGSVDTTAAKGKIGTLLIDPASVLIGNGPSASDGSYIAARSIANNLVFTSVTILATNNIDIVESVDLSRSSYGIPAFDLTLIAPTFNLNNNLNMSQYGVVTLNSNTLNMTGKVTSGGTLVDPSRVRSTATQVNVLANTASIQQAMDLSSKTAPVTVSVSAGEYNENLHINKALTLSGSGATVLHGTQAGGNIITVNANDVTIDGFHLTAQVAGGTLADSVNGIASGEVGNLAVSNNTLEGFAGSGLSVSSTASLSNNTNILSPEQQAAAEAAAQQAAEEAAAQAAAEAAAQQAAEEAAAQAAAEAAAQQAAEEAAAQAAAEAAAQQAAEEAAAQAAAEAAAQQAAEEAAAQAAAEAAAQQAAEEAAAQAAAEAAAQLAEARAKAAASLPAKASARAVMKVAEHILAGRPSPRAGVKNQASVHNTGKSDSHNIGSKNSERHNESDRRR